MRRAAAIAMVWALALSAFGWSAADAAICPLPPPTYRGFAAVIFGGACTIADAMGPRNLARLQHIGSTVPAVVAREYATKYIAVELRNPNSARDVKKIGLATATRAAQAGLTAGFRVRGRP